jgi:hypothetical protein
MSQKEYHNVIIFGAGASFDAGIPLLPSFVDKMWEYAIRGKAGEKKLSDADVAILSEANDVRISLDRYSSRASFNNRDLEDILSLLSFEALRGQEFNDKYDAVVKAVARTIELSCNITAEDCTLENGKVLAHDTIYHELWECFLGRGFMDNFPGIITFNYDLVLERALYQMFHAVDTTPRKPQVDSCHLRYEFGDNYFCLKKENYTYGPTGSRTAGYKAVFNGNAPADAEIPYYKLHGSLNWNLNNPASRPSTGSIRAVETPCILPPVFNKMNKGEVNTIWNNALQLLRKAKHIIVVGYSLPKTDI